MSDWFRGSLVLAATLSAGILIGVWFERSHMHGPANASEMLPVDHEEVLKQLDHTLRLDSTQRTAIVSLLHRHQSHLDSAWRTLRPHVNATLDSTHREIMRTLNPHQRAAFARMMEAAHGQAHHERH